MERRLTAILSADVVGYSRLMGEDEVGTLERLKSCRRELIDPAIKEFHGRMIKLMGDGALVEFGSVVDAVQCAAVIQRRMVDRNKGTNASPADPVSRRRQSRRRHRRGRRHLWRWRQHRSAPGGDGRARRYMHLGHGVRSRGAQGRCRLCRSGRAAPQEHRRSGPRLSGSARSRRIGEDRSRATSAGSPGHGLCRSSSPAHHLACRHFCMAMAKAHRARKTIGCGAAVCEPRWRSQPGLFRRRHHRGFDHRPHQAFRSRCHRPQFRLRLQGQAGGADGRRARS